MLLTSSQTHGLLNVLRSHPSLQRADVPARLDELLVHGIAHAKARGRVGRLREQRRLPAVLSVGALDSDYVFVVYVPDPQDRAEIERLRARMPPAAPVAGRASEASLRQRLDGLLAENRRLRQENAGLRDELALAYGRARLTRGQTAPGREASQ